MLRSGAAAFASIFQILSKECSSCDRENPSAFACQAFIKYELGRHWLGLDFVLCLLVLSLQRGRNSEASATGCHVRSVCDNAMLSLGIQ